MYCLGTYCWGGVHMAAQDDVSKQQSHTPDYKGVLGQMERSVARTVEAHTAQNGQLTTTETTYIATVHNSATGADNKVPVREIDFIGTTTDKSVTGKILVSNGDTQHPQVEIDVEYREPGTPHDRYPGDVGDISTNFGSASLVADAEVRDYKILTSTNIGPIIPQGYSWAPGDKSKVNESNAEKRAMPEVEAMGREVKSLAQSVLPVLPPKRPFKPAWP